MFLIRKKKIITILTTCCFQEKVDPRQTNNRQKLLHTSIVREGMGKGKVEKVTETIH